MKIVFILSDALRYDYISYMPFLKEMSETYHYYKKVIPGIGFCEISEYVTGLPSVENGNLFQITFSGKYEKPMFTLISKLNNFCNHIPRVRRYTQRAFDRYLKKRSSQFNDRDILQVRYNIPINMINYFYPTESRLNYDSTDFFRESNLFSYLRSIGKTYDISDFVEHNKIKGTDEERIDRLNFKIKNKQLDDFTLLYIGKGEIAHVTGTEDERFHQKLTEYDKMLRHTKELLDTSYGSDYRFIILGDHGMVDVKKYIDLTPLLKKLQSEMDLTIGLNFMYFIDSTAFRIWVKDRKKLEGCNDIITSFLRNDLDDIKINNLIYGDKIYILQPGKVFFPDFFNTKKNKGMHGYTNRIEQQKGLCVVIGTKAHKTIESLELQNVKNIVIELISAE